MHIMQDWDWLLKKNQKQWLLLRFIVNFMHQSFFSRYTLNLKQRTNYLLLASGVFYWSDKPMHLQQMTVKENSIINNPIDHFATYYLYLLSHQPGHKFFRLSDDGHKRIPIPEKKDASNIRLGSQKVIFINR